MYQVLTLNKISEAGLSALDKNNFTVLSECDQPDGIVLRSFNMHEMELPKSLRAIARAGAGVNNIPIDKCSASGIVVFNTPGANANAVKEIVIAALLLSSRKIYDGIAWAQNLNPADDVAALVEKGKAEFIGPEIKAKKLGVIGLGAIGVLVANAAVSLGMDVIGYDPFMSIEAAWSISRSVQKAANITEIYENCDYITVHAPYNKETKGLINSDVLSKVKKGLRLLNFSRGELVDNEAVKNALKDGRLSCYVTDFPTGDILGVNGIIPVPHLGASTPESEENCAEMAGRELREFLMHGHIKNSVNYPNCEMPYTGKKRICIAHKNIPNVIGSITTALADKKINIDNMLNRSKNEYAYTIIDVDQSDLNSIEAELLSVTGVISVRVI